MFGDLGDDVARCARWPPGGRSRSARRSRSGGRGRRAPWPARGGTRRRRRQSGTAAWTLAATEPRGGTSGWNSLPIRVRALAIEMTTLPRSWSADRRGRLGGAVPRRGDHDDVGVGGAVVVAGADRAGSRSGHCSEQLVDRPPWPGTSTASRPRPRSRPTPAGRPARCPPARCHPGSRCARRHPTGVPGTEPTCPPRVRRGRSPRPRRRGPGRVPPCRGTRTATRLTSPASRRDVERRGFFAPRRLGARAAEARAGRVPWCASRHGQQTEATNGYGFTAPPPPGWSSKCRWGVPAALPESPT